MNTTLPSRFATRPLARAAALAVLCGSASSAAMAQATPTDASAPMLPTVKVVGEKETATGPVDGYVVKRAASGTKTDTPLGETPQAITVITRDMITDTGATGVQDALNYAAGVRSNAYGLDSRGDWARIRGTDPAEYQDGLQKHISGYYTSSTRTDPYLLERIEVLRGPSGMLFGQGSTGGLINMVSKRPQAQAQGDIGIQFGSWERRQVQGDFTGALTQDGEWLYRVVGVARTSDTQVDHVPDDRLLLAPSFTWRPSAATTLTLQALVQKDESGSTSQFFPWSGTVSPNPNGRIPTNRFIGEPDLDHYDSERQSLGWLFEHRFNDTWTVRQNLRWSHNDVDYVSFYADSFTAPGQFVADPVDQRVIGRFGWFQKKKVDQIAADQHVQGDLRIGTYEHKLLAGVDYAKSTERTREAGDNPIYYPDDWGRHTVPNIDVYNPVYAGSSYVMPALAQLPKTSLDQIGLYLQDQMRLSQNLVAVAGIRRDKTTNSVEGTDDEDSDATTKRFGVIYNIEGWSPYLSYSESFTPVSGLNCNGGRFEPQRGKQWELGLKYLPDAPIAFGAAAYRLNEKNRLVPTSDPNCSAQTGETETTGIELDARATLAKSLEIIASVTRTNIDEALEGLPRDSASIWAKYSFAVGSAQGFSVGLGARWMDSYRDGSDPAVPRVPSNTIFDALLAWDTPSWRFAVNATNLTDKIYVSTCGARGDCWWGARRSVIATVSYRY